VIETYCFYWFGDAIIERAICIGVRTCAFAHGWQEDGLLEETFAKDRYSGYVRGLQQDDHSFPSFHSAGQSSCAHLVPGGVARKVASTR
jgi:hypothetical protein